MALDAQIDLSERMFAVGHEYVGLKVTFYSPTSSITTILEALDPLKREVINDCPFGKLIALTEKPTFFGRFGRFMLSRLLKVNRKHEILFLFAGKPIRFSLREFAIVIGLLCGKFPKKSKRNLKNNIAETPYWPSLFGKLDSVPVDTVTKILKRNTVTVPEMRIKLALLAVLSSMLLPITHAHKIVKEHVEHIKDIHAFYAYPWGRLAFDMLVSSVRERNEITLSHNMIAIKGFVHAMQLVIVQFVPTLLEVVQMRSTLESESDEDGVGDDKVVKTVSSMILL